MHACCDSPLSVDSMTLTRSWREILEAFERHDAEQSRRLREMTEAEKEPDCPHGNPLRECMDEKCWLRASRSNVETPDEASYPVRHPAAELSRSSLRARIKVLLSQERSQTFSDWTDWRSEYERLLTALSSLEVP